MVAISDPNLKDGAIDNFFEGMAIKKPVDNRLEIEKLLSIVCSLCKKPPNTSLHSF